MAVVLTDDTTVTVVSARLPINHADLDSYVLWGLGDGDPRALLAFDVTNSLHPTVHTADQPASFTAFAVSLEPGPTPPIAPSKIIATGTTTS